MIDFTAARLRANPVYQFIPFTQLPEQERQVLAALQGDEECYGILQPTGAFPLTLKSVDRNTALLFTRLQAPQPLPANVKVQHGEAVDEAITQLVLDRILEVETGDTFVSGPDAYQMLHRPVSSPASDGKIARLSVAALQYAQALEINDVAQLSLRLYFYNRLPASLQWRRKFSSPEAVITYLGVQSGGAVAQVLARHQYISLPAQSSSGWLAWRRHTYIHTANSLTYKLYISPACEYIRPTFQAAATIFAQLGVSSFKVGRDVYGLLRPDKLVAYFDSFDELQHAAAQLGAALASTPAQGVPFTAALDEAGLLSWGIDPPKHEQSLGWAAHESWRLWLTNRLAAALLLAKAGPSSQVEPWQFAIERLRFEGIEPYTWTPSKTLWDAPVTTQG